MATLLIILCIVAAVLLILAVLVQPGKADMIAGMGGFGGQFSNVFGHRQSRNILQNLTIGLLAFILLASIAVNTVLKPDVGTQESSALRGADVPVTPAGPVQGAPTQQQTSPAQPQQQQQPAPQGQ